MNDLKEQFNTQFSKAFTPLKEYWDKQNEKTRKTIIGTFVGVVAVAVLIVLALNITKSVYVPLYPEMTASETTQVYAILKEMPDVNVSVSNSGVIEVPKSKKSDVMIELASRGFPQTTLTYDTFLNNTSFTMTDSEKKQVLVYQLQDRIQATIKSIEGVDTAIVNLNVAQDSGKVWETTSGESSASVVVGMKNGFRLSPDRVLAIKNLVSFAIPNTQLEASKVQVIDAATGVAVDGDTVSLAGDGSEYKRLEYEREIEQQIEEKIRSLLAPIYGADGVTAICTVKLNYDKVVQEDREVIPGADGSGVIIHKTEDFTAGTSSNAGDIVGEENNTDVPGYQNLEGNENGENVINYGSSTDYDVSTRIVQTEAGIAVLEYASASVLVNDPNFTQERQERLQDMISTAVNIVPDRLSVDYLDMGVIAPAVVGGNGFFGENTTTVLIIGGVFLALIIIAIIIVLILLNAAKKRKKKTEAEAKKAQDLLKNAQNQLEERKRSLTEAAIANDTEQNGLTNDVRQFAKANPEIAAALIRSMLKEDE